MIWEILSLFNHIIKFQLWQGLGIEISRDSYKPSPISLSYIVHLLNLEGHLEVKTDALNLSLKGFFPPKN